MIRPRRHCISSFPATEICPWGGPWIDVPALLQAEQVPVEANEPLVDLHEVVDNDVVAQFHGHLWGSAAVPGLTTHDSRRQGTHTGTSLPGGRPVVPLYSHVTTLLPFSWLPGSARPPHRPGERTGMGQDVKIA